jgi:hypothetical protein
MSSHASRVGPVLERFSANVSPVLRPGLAFSLLLLVLLLVAISADAETVTERISVVAITLVSSSPIENNIVEDEFRVIVQSADPISELTAALSSDLGSARFSKFVISFDDKLQSVDGTLSATFKIKHDRRRPIDRKKFHWLFCGKRPHHSGTKIYPSLGASVPAAAASLITTVYSADASVSRGASLNLPANGSVPILFAGSGNKTPLVLAVDTATGVLDVNSTAIGFVRSALGLLGTPPPLTSSAIEAAIKSSDNYARLSAAILEALTIGQSPLDSDEVVDATWDVTHDSAETLAAIINEGQRSLRAEIIDVTPPLPFYLIDSLESTNIVFLQDEVGTPNVSVLNQTFIAWQLSSTTSGGVSTSIAAPMKNTALQLLGSYAGSASATPMRGEEPEFGLKLYQGDTSKTQNVIGAFARYVTFAWSAATGLTEVSRNEKCFIAASSRALTPSFAALIAQRDGAAALSYAISIFPTTARSAYSLASACARLPPIKDLFGKTVAELWLVLNLAQSATATIGSVYQTFHYWDYSQDFRVCKLSGQLVSCGGEVEVRMYSLPIRGPYRNQTFTLSVPGETTGTFTFPSGEVSTSTLSWGYTELGANSSHESFNEFTDVPPTVCSTREMNSSRVTWVSKSWLYQFKDPFYSDLPLAVTGHMQENGQLVESFHFSDDRTVLPSGATYDQRSLREDKVSTFTYNDSGLLIASSKAASRSKSTDQTTFAGRSQENASAAGSGGITVAPIVGLNLTRSVQAARDSLPPECL